MWARVILIWWLRNNFEPDIMILRFVLVVEES